MSGYGRRIIVTSAVAAVLVLGVGLGLYYTTTGNYSVQAGGDQTITATYANTLNAITSTTTSSQTTPGGSYTYSPSSPVKILSVQAFANQEAGSKNRTLSFSVEFQNVGSSTIYVVSGGGSSLSATILSGPAHSQIALGPKCEIVSAEIAVRTGQNFTSVTPGCWSGYTYQLSQPGTIEVELSLSWSTSVTTGASGGVTDIMAEFTF
jgi:hypothetical protein